MLADLFEITLPYGHSGRFPVVLPRNRVLLHHQAPTSILSPQDLVQAFAQPVDFPPLHQAFVPDDRLTVVLESDTPQAAEILVQLWAVLDSAGIEAENVTILQPASWEAEVGANPLRLLPSGVREAMKQVRHDPTRDDSCTYLASTASGERVYLSRHVTDADAVIVIGPVEYDPLLGVRGGASCLYPHLSDVDAFKKSQGQGHDELGPEEARPQRQRVDEIGWLLGLQIAISVVPGAGENGSEILVGLADRVLQQARLRLDRRWRVACDERAELVLVSVPADAAGHGWRQVSAAIDVARRLVQRNGRIVVLSQLDAPLGPGLELLRGSRTPVEALRSLQRTLPPDLLVATRIAAAAEWANVSVLTKLGSDVVEDLFLLPVESELEVERLLEQDDDTTIVEAAQHAFAQCGV